MSNGTPDLSDPERLQKFFEKWWGTAASISGTVATALGALNLPPPWAKVIAVIVTLVGLGVTVLLYRRQAKKQQARIDLDRRLRPEEQQPAGAAFRGLRRFHRGERLPGANRRRAAATLLAQVQHPTFQIGIVTGDSGAGKSSLLECALVEPLEKAGVVAEFVPNFATILPFDNDNIVGPEEVRAAWQALTDKVAGRRPVPGAPIVVILDQFEELLSRLRAPAARETLGDQLREAMSDGWRIVIGLRKEYLAELKDVAARLGRPVSLQDTFILRNLDLSEAKDIIRECAQRDGITLDEDLPELIADDLAVDGTVRPPDLQIVCEALHGDLTVDRYRRERRAAGLRSRFIKDTIDLVGDPVLARAILRELCDLPNNKKRPEPLTAAVVAAKARAGTPGARATVEAVDRVFDTLSRSYIVVRTHDNAGVRWSLVHDYLVEPIKLATEEQATRTEAAAAELEYFLAEAANGRPRTISLRRLTEIRRYAPPALLTQGPARILVRRSLLVGYGKPAALVTTIAVVSSTAVLLAGAQWNVWRTYGEPLSHWDSAANVDRRGFLSAQLLDRSSSRWLVVQQGFRERSSRATVWDVQTGTRVTARSGSLSLPSPAKGTMWSYEAATGRVLHWHGNETEPISSTVASLPRIDANAIDEFGAHPDETVVFGSDFPSQDTWLVVLSVKSGTWTVRGKKDVVPKTSGSSSLWDEKDSSLLRVHLVIVDDKARLTVWPRNYTAALVDRQFETDKVTLFGVVETETVHYVSFLVSGRDVETIETIPIRVKTVNATGFEVLGSKMAALPKELTWLFSSHKLGRARWADGGQTVVSVGRRHLLVDNQQTRTVIWPLDPINGEFRAPIISAIPAPEPVDVRGLAKFARHDARALLWTVVTGKGVMVWRPEDEDPFPLPQISIQATDRVEFAKDYSRLLIVDNNDNAQLWSVDRAKRVASLLRTISVPNVQWVKFSDDEHMVIARQRGGMLYGWTQDGDSRGALGFVSSRVLWITYDETCERVFIWTDEGQRIEWRLGIEFPLYGFHRKRACSGERRTAEHAVRTGVAELR